MRLVTAEIDGKEAIGLLVGNDLIMLTRAYAALLHRQGKTEPEKAAESTIPSSMVQFIEKGNRLLGIAKESMEFVQNLLASGKAIPHGVVYPKGEYRLLAPIPRPPTVHVVAVNNRRTLEASRGTNVSGNPLVCMKAPSSVIGDQEAIMIPSHIKHAGPECELGVVIGRLGRFVPKDKALDYVFGYTIVNDVTAYDLLYEDVLVHGPLPHERKPGIQPTVPTGRFTYGAFRAKSQHGFTPVGPAIATKDCIDPENIELGCTINGDKVQLGRTNNYAFSVADVIAFLSTVLPLLPGDIVSMGRVSPEHRPLKNGDLLVSHGEGIGELHNPVRTETRG